MLSALLETTTEKILSTDPATLELLSTLNDKLIAIDIKKLNQSIYLRIQERNIVIESAPTSDEEIDVRLKAKPSTLLKISRQGLENAELDKGELEIEGDAITGQRFAKVLNNLDIDWEELLAEKLGDTPARLIFDMLEKANIWRQETKQTMTQNINEFLVEEAKIVAHPLQVEAFLQKVDTLRNDTARLDARVNQIKQQLSNRQS